MSCRGCKERRKRLQQTIRKMKETLAQRLRRERRASSPKPEYHHLYKSARWKALRELRLGEEPLCRFCMARKKIVPASVVDHVKPHKGDDALFFDFNNTQSLCASCHNSAKQSEERLGYSKEIGLDGWPVDPRHPSNQHP
jgi:5-methylcytosine-specific restriction endonuclease McrA